MRQIKLNSPKYGTHVVLIDDEDFEVVSKKKWCIAKRSRGNYVTYYAITSSSPRILMHRLILKTKKTIDHKDCNGLNNQKNNLRKCEQWQNVLNKRVTTRSTTGFKGVYLSKNCPRPIYWAHITISGKRHALGCYETPQEAAKAYNEAALKYHGEFARLNPILV